MRRNAKLALIITLLCGGASLAGCGGGDKNGTKVEMKDMEVVDGTATDAMTDLDGVQSEGTAIALPAGNTASNASAPATSAAPASAAPARAAPARAAAGDDGAEVLADQ